MSVLGIFWLLLPAGFANMAAPVAAKLFPALGRPIDGGVMLRGHRLLGENKTWRGLVAGTLVAELVFLAQVAVAGAYDVFAGSSYDLTDVPLFVGAVLGFGALFGDMVKSFFKRQIGIASGRSWLPFDQIDWIVGSLLFVLLFVRPVWWHVIVAVIVGFAAHILVKFIGYKAHLDKEPL